IFAMDRPRIEKSVRDKYPGFSEEESKIYLEKMFQLTFSLPAKEQASLVSFVQEAMSQMGITITNERLLQALVESFGRNLRNLKLFLNSFNFRRHLVADPGSSRLADEVLFKWLYVDTLLPGAVDLSLRQ